MAQSLVDDKDRRQFSTQGQNHELCRLRPRPFAYKHCHHHPSQKARGGQNHISSAHTRGVVTGQTQNRHSFSNLLVKAPFPLLPILATPSLFCAFSVNTNFRESEVLFGEGLEEGDLLPPQEEQDVYAIQLPTRTSYPLRGHTRRALSDEESRQ